MRISTWVWLLPSALYVVLTCVGSVLLQPAALPGWAVAAALASTLAAAVVAGHGERTGRHGAGWVVLVLLLVAAACVHGFDGAAIGSSLLLTGMPAGWTAFERGARGAAAGAVGIWTVAATPYVSGQGHDRDTLQRWDDVVAGIGLTAMVLLTWYVGRVLRQAQSDLVQRSRSLEREAATTRAIFESVDVALAVFLPGDHVLVNAPAAGLGHGLVVQPATARQQATASQFEVVDADGVTVTAPAAQAVLRAQRGEEFSGLVQWTGPREARRAMVCSSRRIRLEGTCEEGSVGTVFVAWDASESLDAARVRDEFLGTLTHELRTPLTAIVGYLDLHDELDLGSSDGAAHTYLDGVRRNVRALADHIEDLLLTARPEALSTGLVDVAALARSAVDAAAERARTAGLDLTLDGPATMAAFANDVAVRQVLDHLIDNALTYTESGGVRVDVARCAVPFGGDADAGPGFTVSVTDTGIGMTEHELARVFDRFYRTEAAVQRVLPGLGMGLAVTKQLVAAHGGTITAQSTPGAGSRFQVTIPPLPPEASAT
ncbi:HAMP domain-containing histidine kinase [Nocardioides sp. J2M5]|uniref:sensor histidine kinase n=1 Tax=Nocardioides palaemonis TaxID=2829810 RepID=UPI001BA834E1|nr:HAMP domain-containing sensor histidine kinase [Nocardioides palaemonis]MBS2936498.1 HAMP domain-containing histidine kinase [Nocardioides palaemonis]